MKIWISLAIWILASMSAGLIGSQFQPGEWYTLLEKPSWNPPGWIFAPVWTLLYILMGIAAWMVWKERGFTLPVYLFIGQLALNALWSYLFFGAHRPDLAFFEIVLLFFSILATTVLFWKVRASAGALLVPYLLWVSFASILNLTIWKLNS
jgi:benzodiazapine receptor